MEEKNNDIEIKSEWGDRTAKVGAERINNFCASNEKERIEYLKWFLRGANYGSNNPKEISNTLNFQLRNKLQPLQTLLDILDAIERKEIKESDMLSVKTIMDDLKKQCRDLIKYFTK